MADEKTVADPSPAWERMASRWDLIDALLSGTDAVRETSWSKAGSVRPGSTTSPAAMAALVPRREKESQADYYHRLHSYVCVPSFLDDAIQDVVGAILGGEEGVRPSADEPLPSKLAEWAAGPVDRDGNALDVVLSMVTEAAVARSLSYIFVGQTEEVPFLRHLTIKQVIETAYELDGNRWRLMRARVRLKTRTRDGWAYSSRDRVMVYHAGNDSIPREAVVRPDDSGDGSVYLDRYVRFEVWEDRRQNEKDEPLWIDITGEVEAVPYIVPPLGLSDEAEAEFVEIPLFPLYGGRYVEPWVAFPLFEKVAELVRKFMVKESVKDAIEETANVPRDVFDGSWEDLTEANRGNPVLGGGGIICTDGHKLSSYEHSGAAIGALRQSQEDLKRDIGEASFQAVMQKPSGRELATAHLRDELRRATRLHLLRAFVRQGFESALRRVAAFYDVPDLAIGEWIWPPLDLSRMMRPAEASDRLERLALSEVISAQTALEGMQELGTLPAGIVPEDEPARLRAQRDLE